jgi:methionyl-tRNA formyltransferase
MLDGKKLKIFSGKIENASHSAIPGSYLTDGKSFLKFAAADGYFHVTELQLEGKKRMDVLSFLRGHDSPVKTTNNPSIIDLKIVQVIIKETKRHHSS